MNAHLTPSIHASISGIHFFVGAGASHRISNQDHHDFPLGSSLLQNFNSVVSDADARQLPRNQKSWAIENFNKHDSIDEFLGMATCVGHRDLVELARKFVDLEISRCEARVDKYFKDHSKPLIVPWIERFLNFMTQDVCSYEVAYRRLKWVDENNNSSYPAVNFATLNYDRLIEISLLNYFVDRYPNDKGRIAQDFETLGNLVQHHHGSLGSLQERPFGKVEIEQAPTLKFWFEFSKDPQSWPILNALSNARYHSVFLGFGFHQSIATRFDFQGSKPKIYISDFGNELEGVIEKFSSTHELYAPTITNGADCCVELIHELINRFPE